MESTFVTEKLLNLLHALPSLLESWGQLVLLGIPLCFFLASVILPFIVLFGLFWAHFGRRSLYERCSRQLAGLGNILNWLFLGCAAAGFFVAYQQLEMIQSFYLLAAAVLGGLLSIGTLLWTLVVLLWKTLRKAPVVHALLIIIAGSCLTFIPIGGLALGRVVIQGTVLPASTEPQVLLDLLLPELQNPFWLVAGLIHFLEAAAAGGVGLLWLLFRRHVDDFGRDYYTFAANWCADWSTYGSWLALLLLGGIVWFLQSGGLLALEQDKILIFTAGMFATLFIPAVLWTIIARSALPMRHKFSMVIALVLFVASLASSGALILFE